MERGSVSLGAYGLSDEVESLALAHLTGDRSLGRVTGQDRGSVVIVTNDGEQRIGTTPRMETLVGDWVILENEAVLFVLPRSSYLRRASVDASSNAQGIAANVDIVLLVCGLDRPVKLRRIERAAAQAWDSGASPLVVLTKGDLVEDASGSATEITEGLVGVDVMLVAAVNGAGVDDLLAHLDHKTAVMVGESGAGKSTLTNALIGRQVVRTGEVRSGDAKGRHTTTRREMHVLDNGGVLIDTPGIRSLGLWTDAAAIDQTFADIAALAEECRFRDCAHDSEPGCAVKAAVDAGTVALDRYDSWVSLRKEVAASELRNSEHLRRQSERRFGHAVEDANRMKGKPG